MTDMTWQIEERKLSRTIKYQLKLGRTVTVSPGHEPGLLTITSHIPD